MKKFIAALLILIVALSLVGCGSKGPKKEDIAYKEWCTVNKKDGTKFVFSTVDDQKAYFAFGKTAAESQMLIGKWELKDDTVVFSIDNIEDEMLFKCVYDDEGKLTLEYEGVTFYEFERDK